MVFLKFFISNVVPKTITKVWHGCAWGVAVEILTKKAKMKKMFENDHLYEYVTFHKFGRHIFTWSWISIYVNVFICVILCAVTYKTKRKSNPHNRWTNIVLGKRNTGRNKLWTLLTIWTKLFPLILHDTTHNKKT